MIAMFTKCLRPICHQYARGCRPKGTCVGCIMVEYLFIVFWPSVCDLEPIRGCVLSTIININRPDGATHPQTVYVPKYSPRAWSLRLLEANILRNINRHPSARARVVSAIVGN